MVKFLPKKGLKSPERFVYDNENPLDAEFVGVYRADGTHIPDRSIRGNNTPEEFLWALSPKNRYTTPEEGKKITAHEIKIEGVTYYWFSFED